MIETPAAFDLHYPGEELLCSTDSSQQKLISKSLHSTVQIKYLQNFGSHHVLETPPNSEFRANISAWGNLNFPGCYRKSSIPYWICLFNKFSSDTYVRHLGTDKPGIANFLGWFYCLCGVTRYLHSAKPSHGFLICSVHHGKNLGILYSGFPSEIKIQN